MASVQLVSVQLVSARLVREWVDRRRLGIVRPPAEPLRFALRLTRTA